MILQNLKLSYKNCARTLNSSRANDDCSHTLSVSSHFIARITDKKGMDWDWSKIIPIIISVIALFITLRNHLLSRNQFIFNRTEEKDRKEAEFQTKGKLALIGVSFNHSFEESQNWLVVTLHNPTENPLYEVLITFINLESFKIETMTIPKIGSKKSIKIKLRPENKKIVKVKQAYKLVGISINDHTSQGWGIDFQKRVYKLPDRDRLQKMAGKKFRFQPPTKIIANRLGISFTYEEVTQRRRNTFVPDMVKLSFIDYLLRSREARNFIFSSHIVYILNSQLFWFTGVQLNRSLLSQLIIIRTRSEKEFRDFINKKKENFTQNSMRLPIFGNLERLNPDLAQLLYENKTINESFSADILAFFVYLILHTDLSKKYYYYSLYTENRTNVLWTSLPNEKHKPLLREIESITKEIITPENYKTLLRKWYIAQGQAFRIDLDKWSLIRQDSNEKFFTNSRDFLFFNILKEVEYNLLAKVDSTSSNISTLSKIIKTLDDEYEETMQEIRGFLAHNEDTNAIKICQAIYNPSYTWEASNNDNRQYLLLKPKIMQWNNTLRPLFETMPKNYFNKVQSQSDFLYDLLFEEDYMLVALAKLKNTSEQIQKFVDKRVDSTWQIPPSLPLWLDENHINEKDWFFAHKNIKVSLAEVFSRSLDAKSNWFKRLLGMT